MANQKIAASDIAIVITVNKEVINPLLVKLHKAAKDCFPAGALDIDQVLERLENNENWAPADAFELEHIRIVEADGLLTISLSAELAEAYINVTVKSLPVVVSLYTALINLKNLFKISGVMEAFEQYARMTTMRRVSTQEKKTKK